jgi:DNA polymerase III epsilon subunit-like protein
MAQTKPKGYFEKILIVDCETSGMCSPGISDDPSHNPETGETYQSVAWGLIVANAITLKPIEELYVEIKWDGVSVWDPRAQAVHGLSLEHLEANGMESADAVCEIAGLIIKHWGPNSHVTLAGQNVASFDLQFLKRLLRSEDINVKFSHRTVDTNAIGFAVFTSFTSNELFETVGIPARDPAKHNALDDARCVLTTLQTVRSLFKTCIGE